MVVSRVGAGSRRTARPTARRCWRSCRREEVKRRLPSGSRRPPDTLRSAAKDLFAESAGARDRLSPTTREEHRPASAAWASPSRTSTGGCGASISVPVPAVALPRGTTGHRRRGLCCCARRGPGWPLRNGLRRTSPLSRRPGRRLSLSPGRMTVPLRDDGRHRQVVRLTLDRRHELRSNAEPHPGRAGRRLSAADIVVRNRRRSRTCCRPLGERGPGHEDEVHLLGRHLGSPSRGSGMPHLPGARSAARS